MYAVAHGSSMQGSNSNDDDDDSRQLHYHEQGRNGYAISPALPSSESAGILSAASTSTGNGASLEGNDGGHGSQYSHEDAHSYASPPHTPFSPRAMAIQQLRRMASQREGRNGGAGVHAESQQQENSSLNTPISANTSENGHSAHSHSSSTGSPLNRGPSIKRIGLERSTSDAARRMAMAKLTGEKVTAPPEYTMPKTTLPAGPLPSLADLQARHEQRLALGSPEPVASTSYAHSRSPSAGLSRNPSSGSNAALSRQPSAASSAARSPNNSNNNSNLSRNPSVARSLASRAGAHSPSQSTHDLNADGEDEQKRTEERQEARTNLIRKLSRGRLAGAAAAANIRDRHAANGGLASPSSQPQTPDLPASPAQVPDSPSVSLCGSSSDLQRRPSLAGLLSRAESRNQARAQTPETPQRQQSVRRAVTPLSGQRRSPSGSPSSQREEISTPSTSTTHSHTHSLSQASQASPFSMQSMLSPPGPASSAGGASSASIPTHIETVLSAASHHSSAHAKSPASASSLAARRGLKGKYEHIPVPPTPETASSLTSASASASGSMMGASFASEGGRAMPTHESVYSAVSNFRPYRHTMERDRDSAMARMQMEDNFEFELSALEAARASAAPPGTLAKAALLHENHPLSADDEDNDDEPRVSRRIPSMTRHEQEHDEDRELETLPSPAPMSHGEPHADSEPELQYQQQVPPPVLRLGPNANDSQFFSPPDSPLDARMIPRRAPPQNNLLSAAGPANPHWSTATASTSLSAQARDRAADSLPETPTSVSPASPFTFSPVGSRALSPRVSEPGRDSIPKGEALDATLEQQYSRLEAQEQPSGFLRHHQKRSTDDFPVSVISSHASRYPADVSLIPPEQQHTPPLPSISASVVRDGTVAPPVAMQSAMKQKEPPQRVSASPPPLPEKDSPPSSKKKPAFESDQQAALDSGSPTPVARALFNKKQESPIMQARALDAGPDSEYRFPTASSRHRRPESYTSSNDTHDENINSMIDQLEAMQANGSPDVRNQYKTPPNIPNKTFPEQPSRRADAPVPVQANVKPVISAQQTAAGLASQLRQPLQRTAQARQPSTERASHAAAAAAAASSSSSSGTAGQTFRFPADPPPYASTESAENDSAPSLARSGTGSSSDQSGPSETLPMAEPNNANAQAKEQVMQRLSQLLSSYGNQPKQPTALEKPPRQLLLHSPVLQVVNSNTVKDRFLFLFTDIMVIAKPLVEEDSAGEPITPSLDTKFVVKSIVELPKLKLTAQTADTGEDPVQKRKHPLLLTFVDRFANDPKKAVTALIAKAGLSNEAPTIANLLFRNPELNRSQLGAYMAHKDQKPVLKAYCDRFRLTGIRIEDALRVFIGSLRLPNDYAAAEYMLGVFASQWLSSNPGTGMTNDGVVATKLVISMMELNDALHSGIDDEAAAAGNLFSFPNSAITVDDFIAAFRLKDPHGALPDEHLTRIYLSIRKDRLQQAADNAIVSGTPEIDVVTHPSKLPNRLTYRQASENISLTLPKVDPKFAIKLVGQDLRFEPPILTFARSRTATFRVTPTGLGSKAMLFIRLGQNAHLYRNLPINKTFSVERAFMNHTFQLAFVNHLGVKRKYLFSMNSAESKYTWVDTLRSKIESSPIEQADTPRPAKLSSAISLQVLRDALIAPDEPAPVLVNKPAAPGMRPGFNTPPPSRGRSAGGLQRSTSFSKTYPHGLGKAETDLNERRPSATNIAGLTALSARRGSKDDERVSTRHKSGKDIVTAVQQNSLLPLVLGFVSAGQGIDAMPRKPVIPDESAVQPLPPQARGTGRFRDL